MEEGDWYLGVEESMGHAPKMLQLEKEKWNVIKNRFSRNTSKNYNEVPQGSWVPS